jgi:hypothetical protein
MRKTGIALSILAALVLLTISGCKADPVTTTVNTTTTLTQSTTVTQTVQASTVTVTSLVTSTITSTQTLIPTSPTTTTSSPTTTTTPAGDAIATSPDGKLQVISAELTKPTIAMYQVVGQVLNTSNEVLTARITVELLKDSGGLEQTLFTIVSDIQPGQQKTFTASSIDTFANCTDFNISIVVWN